MALKPNVDFGEKERLTKRYQLSILSYYSITRPALTGGERQYASRTCHQN